MAFKLPKDADWYSLYQWIDIPSAEPIPKDTKPAKPKQAENKENISKEINEQEEIPPSIHDTVQPEIEEEKENVEEENFFEIANQPAPAASLEPEKVPEFKQEIALQHKEFIRPLPKEPFRIRPDPMFRLKKILGLTPQHCRTICFDNNPKNSDEVMYACGNMVSHLNCETTTQRLSICPQGTPNITGIQTSKSFNVSFDEKIGITIWVNEMSLISFTPPLTKLAVIKASLEEKYLAIAGKDQYKRDMIIVYNLQPILKEKKIEIEARQLSDFEILDIVWSPKVEGSFVTCGFENVRFWKLKNGAIPGKNVIFQQPIRGQKFIKVAFINRDKEPFSHVVTATESGMLYKIKASTRTVDEIIKGGEAISTFQVICVADEILWATSCGTKIRLWNGVNNTQILEHDMEGAIQCSNFNLYGDKITILDAAGNVGVLKLKKKTYETLMRSHMDSLIDCAFSKPCSALVTGSKDGTIRVWGLSELTQIAEFTYSNDELTGIACHPSEPYCVCGFSSGFLRVFDLSTSQLVTACGTTGRLSPDSLKSLCYSWDGATVAVLDIKGRVFLIDAREKRYEQFKTIETDHINSNYSDMCFSPDNELFAHIGSNANVVCIWETTNYSLKYQLDLPGEVISKIKFSGNCKDFLVLTATSKIKYFRIDTRTQRCQQIMEIPGIHDLECTDFCISGNCAFIITSGKDGILKVFDYAMRGEMFPAFQAYLGHQGYPCKILLSPHENSLLASISKENNFIYIWDSYTNSQTVQIPGDITENIKFENTENTQKMIQGENEKDLQPIGVIPQAHPHPIAEPRFREIREIQEEEKEDAKLLECQEVDIHKEEVSLANKKIKTEYVIGYNGQALDNIVWEKGKWIAYTSTNKILIENLEGGNPDSRKQIQISCSADRIDGLTISPNKKLLAGYSKQAIYSGSTTVYIISTETWATNCSISIPQPTICSVEFSPNNILLMVLTTNASSESVLYFYDPTVPELMHHRPVPYMLNMSHWNPSDTVFEFVVLASSKYEFWRLTPELNLEYQEGKLHPSNGVPALTSFAFSELILGLMTILLAIGKENGTIDLIDTRTNAPVATATLCGKPITRLLWTKQRLIFTTNETSLFSICIDTQEYYQYNLT